MECLVESGIIKEELLQDLLKEANELFAIFRPPIVPCEVEFQIIR